MNAKFKRVLLINPAYSKSYFSIPVLPAGLGYLAESLKSNNISYKIFDMSLGYKKKDLIEIIKSFKPELIGITCITYMINNTYDLVSWLKREFPDIKIVMGGPHVSSIKDKVIKDCPELDFAVTGEGEHVLIELCSGVDLKNIIGLVYKENNQVKFTGSRKFIENLDSLGFPRYDGFELDRYGYKMIGIVTSRGCPYSCIYCSCNVIGKTIRFRSPESILNEIKYWYDLGYREFGIQEDNPTFDRNRMLEICKLLQKEDLEGLKLMCGNGVRADRVDKELLIEMKKAGFKRLAFGVESGSDKVLKSIKKGSTVEVMDRAIKEASELGFFVSLFFLIGAPGETVEDVKKSISLALRYHVHCVDFFNLIPLPGSELYAWVERNRYFVRFPSEYLNAKFHPARSINPVFETPEFPKRTRMKMLKKTRGISRLIRRRVLESRFPRLGVYGKVLFWLYCTEFINKIENKVLSNEFLRNTVGNIRMKIRNKFY